MDAELLKYYLHRNGGILNDLAGALGINPTTLYRKMRGTTDFTRNEIKLIKDYLQLDNEAVDAIFFS